MLACFVTRLDPVYLWGKELGACMRHDEGLVGQRKGVMESWDTSKSFPARHSSSFSPDVCLPLWFLVFFLVFFASFFLFSSCFSSPLWVFSFGNVSRRVLPTRYLTRIS